jgi:hypothetical protein
VKLRDLAHSRAGDKGNTANVSVIAFRQEDYLHLVRHVTAELVKAHFGPIVKGAVTRYELPNVGALNFVLQETLGGGVTRSLGLDPHGKCLSSLILEMDIPEPREGNG